MKVRANWRVWLAFVHDVCAAAVAWVGLYWLRANLDLHEPQLTDMWRTTVSRLTALSIELHSLADDPTDPVVADLDAQLASLRQTLVEVEGALRQLR